VPTSKTDAPPRAEGRSHRLDVVRTKKMARSPHAYVRGSTAQFYQWLEGPLATDVPDGPPVWICGDCHVGNLGPLADADGRIRIHIRDLDQTTIGNPAHDLIRLSLSLASAARGSNLPGVTTARMIETIMDGYESAFEHDFDETEDSPKAPDAVKVVMKRAARRTWKHLAKERLENTRPKIPLGRRFWPVTEEERQSIESLFANSAISRLATMVKSRDDDAKVEMIDVAYWMKGCSSLGQLRYAVLLGVTDKGSSTAELSLMDVKEAVTSLAPSAPGANLPRDDARRVVQGALHVSPFLGERMRATSLLDRPVFIRELMPQDLKLELARLTVEEALKAAAFLAAVVGYAHARQIDPATRATWQKELAGQRTKELDAPSWLWTNVVGLLVAHEETYLEHCRRFALTDPGRG
jgi:uncharacterized protein (DUF2252 family)